MKMRLGLALLAMVAAPALADEAAGVDGFARKFFGRPLEPSVNFACFARVYDAKHLARHPRQNVTNMALLARFDSKAPDYYALTLGLHLRKTRALRTTAADCRAHGDAVQTIECSAACEGGQVDIKLKDDGSVLLSFPHKGSIWSPTDAGDTKVQPTGLGPDDLLFRLDRAAGSLCAPLTEDKDEAAALRKQR